MLSVRCGANPSPNEGPRATRRADEEGKQLQESPLAKQMIMILDGSP